MTDNLAQIEADVIATKYDGGSKFILSLAEAEALVEIARAAQAVYARLEREDDPAWDSPSELDALAAAVARLQKENE